MTGAGLPGTCAWAQPPGEQGQEVIRERASFQLPERPWADPSRRRERFPGPELVACRAGRGNAPQL